MPTPTVTHRMTKDRALAYVTLLVVLAGLVWRVARYLANWPLWGDEAYIAVSLITRDYVGLTKPLEYYQIAPVGFLWAELATIRFLGPSELALRLLPFLCGIGSLILFWRFATSLLNRRVTLVVVALFAVSFYPIRHSNEVKPYAVDLFLAQAVMMLGWRLIQGTGKWTIWVFITCISVIGVWISYPLIFVSGGVGLVMLLKGRRINGSVAGWLAFVGLTVLSWAAMYFLVARPQALAAPFLTQMQTWEDSFPPLDRPWLLPWWIVHTHTGNMMAYPYGGNNFGSLATTLLTLLGLMVLWRKKRTLVLLMLSPLLPAIVAAILHRYPYGTSARISLFMAPSICLFAGQGLTTIFLYVYKRKWNRLVLISSAMIAIVASIAGAVFSLAVPYKDIDDLELREVVQSFASKTEPGDVWVGFNGLATLPQVKQLMLMPWLQHAAQLHFYVLRDAPVRVDWNTSPEAFSVANDGRTWFLLHTFGYDRFPTEVFKAYLDRLGRLGPPEKIHVDIRKHESVEALIYPVKR